MLKDGNPSTYSEQGGRHDDPPEVNLRLKVKRLEAELVSLEEQANRWCRSALSVQDLLALETKWRNEAATECGRVKDILFKLRTLVDQQAEDDGLWFVAQTAAEAYLQQELRQLHTAIEEAS